MAVISEEKSINSMVESSTLQEMLVAYYYIFDPLSIAFHEVRLARKGRKMTFIRLFSSQMQYHKSSKS